MTQRPKILFVAMMESIHTARWISQLHDQGWDIHVVPSNSEESVSLELKHVTIHHNFYTSIASHESVKHVGLRLWTPFAKNTLGLVGRLIFNRHFPNRRINKLAKLIKKLKPDIIHSLELQHAGYMTLEAKKRLGDDFPFPPWIVSSWGNDIYLFGRLKEHKNRIREVLGTANYYISDCKRDIALAKDFGFKGEVIGSYIGGGGYQLDNIPNVNAVPLPSQRKTIVIKGYQSFSGRALFVLVALSLCQDILQDYETIIYFADENVRIAAELLAQETGLQISFFEKAPHSEWLKLLSNARINIGVNISDGTPLTMLESLLVGTFPIQSYTACVNEWAEDGKTALFVPPDDAQAIADAIRKAITDDTLVDAAAKINAEHIRKKIDYNIIQPEVIEHYKTILSTSKN